MATEETFSMNSQSDLGIKNEVSVALRFFSLKSSKAGAFAMPFRILRRKLLHEIICMRYWYLLEEIGDQRCQGAPRVFIYGCFPPSPPPPTSTTKIERHNNYLFHLIKREDFCL